MSFLSSVFHDVEDFFESPRAHEIETQIKNLLPVALMITQQINELAPNRSLEEINKIAEKYAVPTVDSLAAGQHVGNVMLNLATNVLQKNHAPAVATSVLNTVVQLAVITNQVKEKK